MKWWYEESGYITSQPKWKLRTRRVMNERILDQERLLWDWRTYSERVEAALAVEIKKPGTTLAQKFYCDMERNRNGRSRCLVQCNSCLNPRQFERNLEQYESHYATAERAELEREGST